MNIREEQMNAEFTKFHLEGLPFDAVLHKFSPLDLTPQIHDHPFSFRTFILKGSYIERVWTYRECMKEWSYYDIKRFQGQTHEVHATDIHQIIAYPEGECWTLILPGPWERESLEWKFENGVAYYKSWKPDSEWQHYGN
jgi:hypothetical protein